MHNHLFSRVFRIFAIFLLLALCHQLASSQTPQAPQAAPKQQGSLYLVSVGIGDPDNITVRAQKILKRADVVFGMKRVTAQYPELLANKQIYEAGHGLFTPMARRDRTEKEVAQQEDTYRQIIRDAVKAGKTVAIIDYGDPTIYGPQIGYLDEFSDLHPVVIPGISSFNAANAALGRGVTSGKHTHSVILTAAASIKDGYKGTDTLARLAQSRATMVFFTMGMTFSDAVTELRKHYPGDTPIAIILHAGVAEKEQILQATLDTATAKFGSDELPFEHLIYVGDFLR